MKSFLKVVCLLGCFLVSTFSQQPCRPLCMPPMPRPRPPPWVSRITVRQGMDPTVNGEYVLRWDRDNNREGATPYTVFVRERNPGQQFMSQMPTNSSNRFVIGNLSPGVEYEAVVCYTGSHPSSQFTPNCGFCSTCFVGSSRPEIVETDVEITDERSIYSCEATGIPTPTINWTAINQNGDSVSLTDTLNGVRIESTTNAEEFTVGSELSVRQSLQFQMVVCTSVNVIGLDEEEISDGHSSRPTPTIASSQKPSQRPPTRRPPRPPTRRPPRPPTRRPPPPPTRQPPPPQRPPTRRPPPPQPSPTQQGVPVIIEAIKTELSDENSFLYHCEAKANPVPNITWTAQDLRTRQILTLEENNFSGISISELNIDDFKVTSELTILQNPNFNSITCTAMNTFGSASRDQFLTDDTDDSTGGSIGDSSAEESDGPFPAYGIGIIVAGAILIITTVAVIVAGLCIYRKHNKRSEQMLRDLENFNSHGYVRHTTTAVEPAIRKSHDQDTIAKRKNSLISKLPHDMVLSPDVLEVSTVIGQGEFGLVYKGYLKSEMKETVAIKTLKGIFTTASDIENVSAEILKMRNFDHPNVMKLIGVCVVPSDQEDVHAAGPAMVMPFMAKGSLLDNLRKDSDNLISASLDDPKTTGVRKTLLDMCLQVAQGMEYLASLRFIHRDLAARNCLMDANGVIKVSDFGLAEDIYTQNYFRQEQGGVKLPLKWMALESIKLGVFTHKTDVWSYGVTCWEIFNGGAIPYPGIHPRHVLDYLEEGERLPKPKNAACCDTMYALLLSMWDRHDEDRPTFSSIVSTISSFLETTSDYLELGGFEKKNKCEQQKDDPSCDSSSHFNIERVMSSPNDYVIAGSQTE